MLKLTLKNGLPTFTSKGIEVLYATASEAPVALMSQQELDELFGAEPVAENVKYDPYWQIGEREGSIFRLAHFPIDGTDLDYGGMLVFCTEPKEKSENGIRMIAPAVMFDKLHSNGIEFTVEPPADIKSALERINSFWEG